MTTYGYDNANHLTSLVNRTSSGTVLASYSFTLDANGNRVTESREEPLAPSGLPTATVDFAYNAQRNRLVTAGAESFSFDKNGQLANTTGAGYSFGYRHRLEWIGGLHWAYFSYDGLGNRLETDRYGTITRYLYDVAGHLLAEADGSNQILRYYIHGVGLLAMVTASNQSYCYHFDATGNTVAMTDGSQAVVNRYAYTPYGRIVGEVESVVQPFKYVGQYGVMAEPNGFDYMRARYYDPAVGRFISEDPLGFGGGDVNLYGYVGGNPVLYLDPDGLYSLRQGLQDTQTYAWIFGTASAFAPGGQLAATTFAGVGVAAAAAEIALYSDKPFLDSIKESIKLLTPIRNPLVDKAKDEAIDSSYDFSTNRNKHNSATPVTSPTTARNPMGPAIRRFNKGAGDAGCKQF